MKNGMIQAELFGGLEEETHWMSSVVGYILATTLVVLWRT